MNYIVLEINLQAGLNAQAYVQFSANNHQTTAMYDDLRVCSVSFLCLILLGACWCPKHSSCAVVLLNFGKKVHWLNHDMSLSYRGNHLFGLIF